MGYELRRALSGGSRHCEETLTKGLAMQNKETSRARQIQDAAAAWPDAAPEIQSAVIDGVLRDLRHQTQEVRTMIEKIKDYLGDGVTASYDGYHVILELRAQDGNQIALDPVVFSALVRFRSWAINAYREAADERTRKCQERQE